MGLDLSRFASAPFAAFYHIACMGNWRDVVVEQITLCNKVGLAPRAVVLGTDDDVAFVRALGVEVITSSPDTGLFETPTLNQLQLWCKQNPAGSALYFHTKGVSQPDSARKHAWRKVMMHHVVRAWRDNLGQLEEHHTVGVNLQPCKAYPYYMGNFWLARSAWVNRLVSPWHYRTHKPANFVIHTCPWPRQSAEMWLGSKPGLIPSSLCCTQQNFSDGPVVFDLAATIEQEG